MLSSKAGAAKNEVRRGRRRSSCDNDKMAAGKACMRRGSISRGLGMVLAVTAVMTGSTLARAQSQSAQSQPARDWQRQWDAAVAGAKAERELVISAPSGRVWRDQLMEFQKAYPEVELKVTAAASREFWPRVLKEHEVGQYLWDIRVGGPDNLSYNMKARGELAPVRELLILPEVLDDDVWYGGVDGLFLDRDKRYYLGFAMYEQTIAHYNNKIITKPGGLSFQDLLDPQWANKISMADPRGGAALTGTAVLYKLYGEDYVRKLVEQQKPVITKEARQQVQWLASGRYPITFGVPTAASVEMAQRGASVSEFVNVGGVVSWVQGVGGIQLPKNPPHPNAVKVFVNWILTKDVQARLMQAVKLNSRRKDVPIGDPSIALDPAKIAEYVGSQTEEMQDYQNKAADLFRSLIQ